MALLEVVIAEARDRRNLRVDYSEAVKQVDPANADDALNPANYSLRPVNTPQFTAVFTPTVLSVTVVDTDTVDLLLNDDYSYGLDYEVEVLNVETAGSEALDPTKRTVVFTAVDPRPEHRKLEIFS